MGVAEQTRTVAEQSPFTEFSVFWQPGCTSCARVKEYMTKNGIPYRSVNVAEDEGGMDMLLRLGARSVPVVSRGDDFTFAQSIEDVAKFVGREANLEHLAPDVLVERWIKILQTAKTLVGQVPADKWEHRPVVTRDIRFLSWHIFQIPESFIRCIENGEEDWVTISMLPVPDHVRDAEAIIRYGDSQQAEIERWWREVEDKSCRWPVKTYYGEQPAHHFLERQTWHSGQHTRQLDVALQDLGVLKASVIPPGLFSGLPMPEAVW